MAETAYEEPEAKDEIAVDDLSDLKGPDGDESQRIEGLEKDYNIVQDVGRTEESEEASQKDDIDTVLESSQSSEKAVPGTEESDLDAHKSDILSDETDGGSLLSQAGSFGSTSTSTFSESESFTLPKTFQDYVQKYAELFNRVTAKEEALCDEKAGKTFLKIDVNELISGHKTEDKFVTGTRNSLVGATRVRPDLICVENEPIILRKNYKSYKGVRTLSGGHLGNGPQYTEFVGKGMLTGVVLGTRTDPPGVANVTRAMRELASDSPGLLVIVLNNVEYRLIFGLAMERIRMEGFTNVDMIAVGDDCFER